MNTNAIFLHRRLGMRLCAAVAAALAVGCYEGGPSVEDGLGGDVDVAPADQETPVSRTSCDPTMHLFPVMAPHNIGFDWDSCTSDHCAVSCPDLNANSGYHNGTDIFAHRGAPIVAVTSGTIVYADEGTKDRNGRNRSGRRVKLRDDCGWDYYYGHLDTYVDLPDGHRVEAGQVIGTMGNTGEREDGSPYGVHLHFNVSQNGDYYDDIDPIDLLVQTSPTACGGLPPAPEPEPEPPAGECDSVLAPNEALYENQAISSCNGLYTLVMQDDGNVVLYDTMGTALWNSQTAGRPGHAVVMQSDGNFVLYDAASVPLWNTGTHGHPGAALRVEEDGNVIVWEGWTPIWRAR